MIDSDNNDILSTSFTQLDSEVTEQQQQRQQTVSSNYDRHGIISRISRVRPYFIDGAILDMVPEVYTRQ